MDKYKNKYRISSHRKPNWDYSADGYYFLTICTAKMKCILGTIIDGEIRLSVFGKIVEIEWHKSFEIRNELLLHEYVIMPNHMHCIVEISTSGSAALPASELSSAGSAVELPASKSSAASESLAGSAAGSAASAGSAKSAAGSAALPASAAGSVQTHGRASLRYASDLYTTPIKRNAPIRLPKSISSFIAGFKSAVNTKIDDYIDEYDLQIPKYNRKNHFFQPNYHDHIIRNGFEFQRIRTYIINNPANWTKDKFNG